MHTTTPEAGRQPDHRSGRTRIWIILLAAVAAIAIAALAWVLLSLGGKAGSAEFTVTVGKPTLVSESDLRSYGDSHAPVYWAGPMDDVNYELTETTTGATFIRYLPKADTVGTSSEVLTVATYPEQQGFQRLQDAATENNMGSQTTRSNALVVVNPAAPLSTYFSFPDASFQVEVFSPTAGESKQKVLDGDVQLLGTGN